MYSFIAKKLNAEAWLARNNIPVLRVKKSLCNKTPVIEISEPNDFLKVKAFQIIETFNGIRSLCYMAYIEKCWICWRTYDSKITF